MNNKKQVESMIKFMMRYKKIYGRDINYKIFLRELNEVHVVLTKSNADLGGYSGDYLNSAFAGLFWLDRDFTGITDVAGLREFTINDVKNKASIFPDGFHIDRDVTGNIPRGRVSLMDGRVVINVGLDCPDSIIPLIKKEFGLDDLEIVVKAVKGSHWNVK
jgi:hypothetical protein